MKNLKAKNYLGQAKLVAATSPGDAYVGFSGIEAKSTFASETNTPITPTELNRQSPRPLSTKPALSPMATSAIVAPLEESSITPLKLTSKKSSAELRRGPGPSLPARPRAATATAMAKLPRIDTDVFRPSFAHHTSSSYSSPLLKNVPTINAQMPPTPPESEKSKTITPRDRRDTAATTLGYLQDNHKPYTAYVDEIVDGYAGIDVNAGRRRPSLPAHSPYPRGQPLERVAKWANNQIDTVDSGTASRYASPSAPSSKHGSNPSPISGPSGQGSISHSSPGPSRNASFGTLRRYPTSRRAAEYVHTLRRGSLDDYRNPSLASRDGIDDPLSVRSNGMLSFRLKLHFENDVRGMVSGPTLNPS